MTQIRPTSEQVIERWNQQADSHNQWDALGGDEKIEQAFAAGMEEAARICDAFDPDESNPLTTEGQCADAIRAAIPKEKE